jgi:hypothetical protein
LFHSRASSPDSHIARTFSLSRNASLGNASPSSDPLIGRIDHFLQLLIG